MSTAEERAEKLFEDTVGITHAYCEFMDEDCKKEVVKIIATALTLARAEGLEEAAKIVEKMRPEWFSDEYTNGEIVTAIRKAKENPHA